MQGPKLKLERAERHLKELEDAIAAFLASQPYSVVVDIDPKTGEEVHRLRVHKCLPNDLSVIIGDVAHNLRSALDQMICELVRDNRRQTRLKTGFPISTTPKRFEEAVVGKLEGATAQTQRFVRRLKPYQSGNRALWLLHEIDAMDKHVEIIPVAAGSPHIIVNTRLPFTFGEDGSFSIGRMSTFAGIPENSRPINPLVDNVEFYRWHPNAMQNIEIVIYITLGQTKGFPGGEPIFDLLQELVQFVRRVVELAERRLMRKP